MRFQNVRFTFQNVRLPFQNVRLPFQNVRFCHVTCHVWAMKLTCFRAWNGMFGFYILYLLYKSQTFRSKRERLSISLFKPCMKPVKAVSFKTANVRFETTNVRFETLNVRFETLNVRFETARRKLECKSQYIYISFGIYIYILWNASRMLCANWATQSSQSV